jgi:uncharacterized membrane protein (UPF0127 family)
MRKFLLILLVIVILGIAAGALDGLRAARLPKQDDQAFRYATTSIAIGGVPLVLEVADTPEKRSLGLGGREELLKNAGMLFIFDEPGLHGFWMEGMRFPIDIAWFNDKFCVTYLAGNVSPDSYPTVYVPSSPSRYVIEAGAGYFRSHNLKKGSCVRKPIL